MKHSEAKPSESSQRSAVIDRLVLVRKEQDTALPPLAKVQADALGLLEEAREKFKASESEYRRAADGYSSKAGHLASLVQRLETELHELTPTVGDFLNRLSNFIGGGVRHQMTSAQMLEVFRIRDEAQALWEEPAEALPHRLAALEAIMPVVS